jgi:serine/threonine-protein kinase
MTQAVRPGRSAAPELVMGRYRLAERIGAGGSAEVWRGVDERLARPVAVKLLHAHLLRDDGARERFEREARAAAALSHPGIVAVYDVDASALGAAIIFELVDGETLADRLARSGPLAPAEVARIGAELAEALQHAHERGVIHRDVKPGNVLLSNDGRARLVDFGIARVLDAEAAKLTSAGMIAGTLRYLAPEQLAGAEASEASDLYALGTVLYEMATGRPAFSAPTPVALAEAQAHVPADPAGVPSELAAVWREALDPDPARRPARAADMAAQLRAIAGTPIRPSEGPMTAAPGVPAADDGQGAHVSGSELTPPFARSEAPTVLIASPSLSEVPSPRAVPDGADHEVDIVVPWPALAGTRARLGRTGRELLRALLPALLVGALVLAVVLFVGPGIGGSTTPGGITERTPTPAVTVQPSETPAATPTPQEPAGGGNGGGKGKGKGKGGG